MNPAISTGYGSRTGIGSYGESGRGYSGPRAGFDDNVPAGVDPEAQWRFSNSNRFRHAGTTAAERAGAVPGYTPGYGRSSNRNSGGSMGGGASSLTPKAEWDAQFTPHLAGQMQPQLGPQMAQLRNGAPATGGPDTNGNVFTPGLAGPVYTPPSGSPSMASASPTSLPVLPPSPGLGQPPIQQTDGSQSSVRSVTGLPPGQSASATFVPGQNAPKPMAKSRPTADPLAI